MSLAHRGVRATERQAPPQLLFGSIHWATPSGTVHTALGPQVCRATWSPHLSDGAAHLCSTAVRRGSEGARSPGSAQSRGSAIFTLTEMLFTASLASQLDGHPASIC